MAVIPYNKRVTRLLEEKGVVDSQKLRDAAAAAEERGAMISTVLLDMKLIEDRALLGAIAENTRIPPVDLRVVQPDSTVLASFPQEMAFEHKIFPVSRIGEVLTIAVINPYDILKLDEIRLLTGCELRIVLTLEEHLKLALDKAYKAGQKEVESILDSMNADGDLALTAKGEEDEEDAKNDPSVTDDDDSPIVKFVNAMIYQAAKERASDIHIEAFEKRVVVRFRCDGNMREVFGPPKRMLNPIVSRVKIMSALDIAERRRPQDGKFQMKIDGRQIDFRVSILPCIHGEKVVMRLLDGGNLSLSLDSLGFEEKALTDFRDAIAQPYGMILVTGPTGSGKSTTLYSAVREMLVPTDNFVTVEDPVEYQLEGVNQVQVSVKRGLTFAAALRSILRQDPDTILIGEIRDTETIDIAVKAALTGHLVLSTLHTNDAPGTISRMADMGVDPFMVASSTLLVSAQRLCRKLCNSCKEPIEMPPMERLVEVGFKEEDHIADMQFFHPKGCPRCNQGYAGRFAILETLPMTEDIKRIVVKGGSAQDIKECALRNNMLTLRRCGLRAAARGRTALEEVLRVTMHDKAGAMAANDVQL
jgi:type IV pilus assembly protein PilB